MSTDALRVITEIGGRKTTLSGTMEAYAETIALMTGLRGENPMDRVGERLELKRKARGGMVLQSGKKTIGILEAKPASETGDPLLDGAREAFDVASRQEKGVIFLVSSENVNRVRQEISRLRGENRNRPVELEVFDSSIDKAQRQELSKKVEDAESGKFENGKILLLTEDAFHIIAVSFINNILTIPAF